MNDPPPPFQPWLALLIAGLFWGWAWLQILQRLKERRPVLQFEPPPARPWGLLDVLVAFALLSGSQALAGVAIAQIWGFETIEEITSEVRAILILAGSLATVFAFLASLAWLHLRYGPLLTALGFDMRRAVSDARLGFVAFLLLAPLVYGIQMVLIRWVDATHPLIELLRDDPDPQFFLLGGLSAVLVAPIVEEFLFRALLQGWLERIAERETIDQAIVWGGFEAEEILATRSEVVGEAVESANGNTKRHTPLWPVWASAALFALVHISHGPAWVPLLVFGAGLGYLYHRTHRLLPCIVLHFSLNACSMLGLVLSTTAQ